MQKIIARFQKSLRDLDVANPEAVDVEWIGQTQAVSDQTELTALCSSRLGRDASRRRVLCRRLSRVMLDHRGGDERILIVASESAIAPWAIRAAKLFHVPLLSLRFDDKSIRHSSLKDEILVRVCDRLEALYVRRRGAISRSIEDRLRSGAERQSTTRVHVTGLTDCDAVRLIQMGAVGRWLADKPEHSPTVMPAVRMTDSQNSAMADRWFDQEDGWLVHCTRRSDQGQPGQSPDRWMDDCLVQANRPNEVNTPLPTLRSIVTGRRLIASAVTSSQDHPVVCFSAVPLLRLLSRRTYRAHLRRWDYEPFGIAIRRTAAESAGICPVIYGSAQDRDRIKTDQRFRFQAAGSKFDWTAEREYRAPSTVDLSQFSRDDVRVFVPDRVSGQNLATVCPWAITVVSDILSNTDSSIPRENRP